MPPWLPSGTSRITLCFSTVPPHATLRAVGGLLYQDHPVCIRMILHRLSDLCPGVSCATVATQSTPWFVRKASGTGTFHITLDRLLHFLQRPHRLLTDGTNLQWRSDIDAPSSFRVTEYIRHPAFPLRTVLAVFWVSVFVGYSGTPTLRRCNPFLHDPKTLKLLVALGLHLVLRFQITTLSEGSASSSAQPLLTIRLGKFHC
jgi:hypothetical protein